MASHGHFTVWELSYFPNSVKLFLINWPPNEIGHLAFSAAQDSIWVAFHVRQGKPGLDLYAVSVQVSNWKPELTHVNHSTNSEPVPAIAVHSGSGSNLDGLASSQDTTLFSLKNVKTTLAPIVLLCYKQTSVATK